MIFGMLLRKGTLWIDVSGYQSFDRNAQAILAVCKLFNAEAAPILYSQNTFYFPAYHLARVEPTFLDCIGPANSALITLIRLDLNILRCYMSELIGQNGIRDWYHKLPGLRELLLEYDTWHYQQGRFGRPKEIPTLTLKELHTTPCPALSEIHIF